MSVFTTAMTALDEATAVHALDEIERLRDQGGMDDLAVAQSIIGALRELGKLSAPEGSPEYANEWVPPLYSLWYHNSHTQMAYYLAKAIPDPHNPFQKRGPESLYVVDFACGTMAMQFGAAIASSECLREDKREVVVHVQSTDINIPMREYGKGLWKAFHDQIKTLRPDDSVRAILGSCDTNRFRFVTAMCRLTRLYVG